ncbi:hypothetical protein SAMN05421740_108112 [Parapedobacter koreensis]|uniref:Uncharacterized protein n=1 Tax=Parapedobacter koreensis TaxID=332977 RepID=A0A1H7S8Q0_9SPHI|nr:hypothetical protein SAMN05421740_108112 [Parapedobacter koreensis]
MTDDKIGGVHVGGQGVHHTLHDNKKLYKKNKIHKIVLIPVIGCVSP